MFFSDVAGFTSISEKLGGQDVVVRGVAPHLQPLPAAGDMVPIFVMNATRVIPQVNEIMPFLRRRGVGILGINLGGVAAVSELHHVTLAAPGALDQQHGESS